MKDQSREKLVKVREVDRMIIKKRKVRVDDTSRQIRKMYFSYILVSI